MKKYFVFILFLILVVFSSFPAIARETTVSGLAGWDIRTDCSLVISQGVGCYNKTTDTFCIGNGTSCVEIAGSVSTDSNCNQAAYYSIGTLCADTDDGKLYKGTGAAVVEIAAGSSGDIVQAGAPANHYWAYFTADKTLTGVAVTASKPVCTDANGDPAVCAGTEGVWQVAGSYLTSSSIAAAISDSDTTHCPDGNSVYDGLAAKQAAHAALTSISGLTETAGGIPYFTADNTWAVLAKGTAYQLLQTKSDATAPEWTSSISARFKDDAAQFQNATTATKLLKLDLSGITASNTRTITVADGDMTLVAGTELVSGGALGTPSSGTLTNCSGLPVSGITASTSTAIGVGSVELGHATDTTLARVSAGVASIEGVNIVTVSATQTLTNKTLTTPAITIAEVDGHTTSTDLTAAQVSNTQITNQGQAAEDVFLILPTAAAGYSFVASVSTARSNHWCVEAGSSDKIYLIAAAGTVAAGDDGAAVCMVAAQVGQQFACWTFKTGASAYDWACKAIAIGTSTFEAHASSE